MTAFDSVELLPPGCPIRAHWNVRGLPCGSVPDPFNCTRVLWATVWLVPANAVGTAATEVEIVTVEVWLFSRPSFTTNWAVYVPGRSTVKVGFMMVVELKAAALPAGAPVNVQ